MSDQPAVARREAAPVAGSAFDPVNHWVTDGGREFAEIGSVQQLPPFLLSIASASDHWFFCASNGALSAGRRSPESALFPYQTADKIIEDWNSTGPRTAILAADTLWEPMRPSTLPSPHRHRRLRKSLTGDEVVFEEIDEQLGLCFAYSWQLSPRFGFVRRARLNNLGGEACRLRIIDGIENFLPAGVGTRMQTEFSCLADAYKLSELDPDARLLIHRLAAGITDRPIPLEMLRATTVWTAGHSTAALYLNRSEAEEFLSGRRPAERSLGRGRRGCLYTAHELDLEPGAETGWIIVADVEQSQAGIEELQLQLSDPEHLVGELVNDISAGRESLLALVAAADGVQSSHDRDVTSCHYQNTLCNIQRGGVPAAGYVIDSARFIEYLELHNRPLRRHRGDWLGQLPETMERRDLLERASSLGDPDLVRLATEYLPLVLSRRHGDPSRPWNRFVIRVDPQTGQPVHHFEGNWRDIFQNWEALAWSYPGYLDAFISKFVNASTVDGFNPYRITFEGVDWELLDEQDPWSSIGYWGDHQIVYLLNLLDLQARVRPDYFTTCLDEPRHVFVDVPYRLRSWDETLADPRHTIDFDRERHVELMARRADIGSDGLLLRDPSGEPYRATLAEKLLLPAAIKLTNLVPGGGIWMNTQRPEWNDANNALAGCGVSVVTAAYLYRHVGHLHELISLHSAETLGLSSSLARLLEKLGSLLGDGDLQRKDSMDPSGRSRWVCAAGRLAESYRSEVYDAGPGAPVRVSRTSILGFLERAHNALRRSLDQNRRPDGLYHSYNVLEIDAPRGTMDLSRLPEMLEGQVAILNSGILNAEQAANLLEGLAGSKLRSEQHGSYLLYPDRPLPAFLEHNRVDAGDVEAVDTLKRMTECGDARIVTSNPTGGFRFHPSLTNAYALRERLDEIQAGPRAFPGLAEDRPLIEALYEEVFKHRKFTGRSGAMFAYEGLGCVYWHMVSKLLLATQKATIRAGRRDSPPTVRERLAAAYFSIQAGLGFRQPPHRYGAFPFDPYSHSPAHGGARQPGLTGQVKEGILCRFGELGVYYDQGHLGFRPRLLRAAEFGETADDDDPAGGGCVMFTISRTPVTYRRHSGISDAHATVLCSDGSEIPVPGAVLDADLTGDIIHHTGRITRVEVLVPSAWLIPQSDPS